MYVWTEIKTLASEAAFEQYRVIEMCCSQIKNTEVTEVCDICGGEHPRKERRIWCKSKTCESVRPCRVVWKARQCTMRDIWIVLVNDQVHSRGAVPCLAEHRARLTRAMKRFISEQEENNATPRLIAIRMKKQPDIVGDITLWPTMEQIKNALKRVRDSQGSRNAINSIASFVGDRVYSAMNELEPEKAFLFGPGINQDGVPYIGSGHDDDPFIVGVTSSQLVDSALAQAHPSRFTVMHADATFKLSDLAYPVITIGFSDASRSYRLAALFIVSQRTRRDFRLCFQALADIVRRLRGNELHVDAFMGDADDAQVAGLHDVDCFVNATPLMCFFHVLYNVKKRVKHLPLELRKMVMRGIMDMHYTASMEEFKRTCALELERWDQEALLTTFNEYFTRQWLRGKFWRWQVFHTPSAFATTNNPCEVFNATIKKHTQRRRLHMTKLLSSMIDLVEVQAPLSPVGEDFRPAPTSDINNAAKLMVTSGRTTLRYSPDHSRMYVRYVGSRDDFDDTSRDDSYVATFEARTDIAKKIESGKNECAKIDARKQKASQMYVRACSWSLWRAHNHNMPSEGWCVSLSPYACGCSYFYKFQICAHVIITRNRQDLSALGKIPKLFDRSRKNPSAKSGPPHSKPVQPQDTQCLDHVSGNVDERWPWSRLAGQARQAVNRTEALQGVDNMVDGQSSLHAQLFSSMMRYTPPGEHAAETHTPPRELLAEAPRQKSRLGRPAHASRALVVD